MLPYKFQVIGSQTSWRSIKYYKSAVLEYFSKLNIKLTKKLIFSTTWTGYKSQGILFSAYEIRQMATYVSKKIFKQILRRINCRSFAIDP